MRPNTVKATLTPQRPRRQVENDEYAAFARRVLRAYSRRVGDGDVEALTLMVDLADETDASRCATATSLPGTSHGRPHQCRLLRAGIRRAWTASPPGVRGALRICHTPVKWRARSQVMMARAVADGHPGRWLPATAKATLGLHRCGRQLARQSLRARRCWLAATTKPAARKGRQQWRRKQNSRSGPRQAAPMVTAARSSAWSSTRPLRQSPTWPSSTGTGRRPGGSSPPTWPRRRTARSSCAARSRSSTSLTTRKSARSPTQPIKTSATSASSARAWHTASAVTHWPPSAASSWTSAPCPRQDTSGR